MIQLIKASLPGSISFLIAAFIVGIVLIWRPKTKRFGLRWLICLLLMYMVFSIPATARWMAQPLEWGFHPLESKEDARNAQAIVVLDGGTGRFRNQTDLIEIPLDISVLRALEAIRVYRLLDRPLVIVSGGDESSGQSFSPEASVLRNQIINGGVPSDRVLLDSSSINTHAHAVNIVRMLKERRIKGMVLVTSPSHMRRAVWSFQAEGIKPVPSPCKGSLDSHSGWIAWWPSTNALEFTQAAMHEYFGIAYYFVMRHI